MENGLTHFDKEGNASLYLEFAGKKFEVHISNPDKKEYGEYQIVQAYCDEKEIEKRVPLCRDEITLCVIVSHKGTSCSRHLLQR